MTSNPPTGKRQRLCPWCARSFTKDEHLARHVRTHTREKPFSCSVCRKAFSRHDSLLRHSRRHRSCSVLSPPGTESENNPLETANNHEDTMTFRGSASITAENPVDPGPLPSPSFLSEIPSSHGSLSTIIHSHSSNQAITASVEGFASLAQPEVDHSYLNDLGPTTVAHHNPSFDLDMTSRTPAWFAGEDFDLDAFNTSIMSSAACLYPPVGGRPNDESVNYVRQPSVLETRPPPIEDIIRENWFTFIRDADSGTMTPDTAPDQIHVDEMYREHLAVKLQQHIPTLPLPSTDFLNLCVQMYFTRFHPIFPVLHAPTFRPSAKRSLLLLSICSIGSLFLGSAHAVSQGVKIFETLNKCILSCWERCILAGGPEAIAMVQAALLGQTFGLLSKRKSDLLTVQTFHGTVVAWARRFNMFRAGSASDKVAASLATRDPEHSWKSWIHAEERNRIAAGLYIHDVEIAELSLSEPFLRSGLSKVPPVCDEALWSASTAAIWARTMSGALSNPSSGEGDEHPLLQTPTSLSIALNPTDTAVTSKGLRAYLELEGITGCILEGRGLEDDNQKQQHTESLIHLYNSHIRMQREKRPGHDPFLLLVLWHSTFISLYANINRLELVIGKEGHTEAQQHTTYAREWACSPNGQRCALHAIMILRELENMKIGTEPAIHVPRIVFRAAIAWFCHTKFGTDVSEVPPHQPTDFPEFKILGVNLQRVLLEANGSRTFRPNARESGTFRGLLDILQRVGHWGISKNYAYILSLLLPEGSEEERYTR